MDVVPTDRSGASDIGLPGGRIDDLPRLQTEDPHLLRGAGGGSPPGSGDAEGADDGALARAAAIRFPDLKEKRYGREKIDALIDHITETAIVRGELEELRLSAYVNLRDAESEFARVPTGITGKPAAIDEAKRRSRPDIAERVDGARWLIARCSEQISRMGGSEYDVASRAYTLLSGS